MNGFQIMVTATFVALTLNSTCDGAEGGGLLNPGERHYPKANPNAHQNVIVSFTIPADWSIQIIVDYAVSAAYSGSLFGPRCFTTTMWGGPPIAFRLELVVPAVREGSKSVATVQMDHFLPGQCGWQTNGFRYMVFKNSVPVAVETVTEITTNGVAFAYGELAHTSWDASVGDGKIDSVDPNIWCWASDTDTSPIMSGYKLHCGVGVEVKKSLIQYINRQLLGARGRYTPMQGHSVNYIVHDLDAEVAAIRTKMEEAPPARQ